MSIPTATTLTAAISPIHLSGLLILSLTIGFQIHFYTSSTITQMFLSQSSSCSCHFQYCFSLFLSHFFILPLVLSVTPLAARMAGCLSVQGRQSSRSLLFPLLDLQANHRLINCNVDCTTKSVYLCLSPFSNDSWHGFKHLSSHLSFSRFVCLSFTLMSNFTLLICGKLNLHHSYYERNV